MDNTINTVQSAAEDTCCCFTGHRYSADMGAELESRLCCEVETLINTKGVTTFYSGGALGFDTLAAQCVLKLKGKYPFIRLGLVLPCKNQAEKWNSADKRVYETVLQNADSVHYVSDEYTDTCMYKRNDYMVEHSKYCIGFLRRNSGGTHYTVGRAKRLGKELVLL